VHRRRPTCKVADPVDFDAQGKEADVMALAFKRNTIQQAAIIPLPVYREGIQARNLAFLEQEFLAQNTSR
jgi:hypothetical protein